ncbi:MAG: hypothetical protein QOF72_2196 [Blastocatellia bacterium]|jgi:hypothetical protein|nr:hypothetical protein [Blastocatellia bacterium]
MVAKTNEEQFEASFDLAIDELDSLMSEREALDEKRDAIDQRISKLRRGVIGLGALCGLTGETIRTSHPELFPDDPFGQDTGLTDAVREVLKTNEGFMSPVAIRDYLKKTKFDIGKYKNALASIHTVLKRLRFQDEVQDSIREGRTIYRWKPKPKQAIPDPLDLSDDDVPF